MFFFAPVIPDLIFSVLAVYVLAAVLPAIFLMRYVYRQDQIEPEPVGLLASLVWKGVLAALAAIVLESLGQMVLDGQVSQDNPNYVYYLAFLVVAAVEEGTKLFFLYRRTWKEPDFNYRFDAIVYAVMVALGFAAFENVKYVYSYGFATGLVRAVTAVPGHAIFGVFMGYFYGYAKLSDYWGRDDDRKAYLALSVVVPVLLHGCYDFLAFAQEGDSRFTLLFYAYLIALYVFGIRRVNRSSRDDRRVTRETVFDYFRRMQYPMPPQYRDRNDDFWR